MKKLLTLTAIGTVIACSSAHASGFYLREQSAAAMGNAMAGAAAGAEDISYSFFNPAAISRHKGNNFNFNATYLKPVSKAKNAAGTAPVALGGAPISGRNNDGQIISEAVIPATYVSHQFDDKWTGAISLTTPFGLITKYDADWVGRFHGTTSDVKTINLTPMMSYQATPELAVAAGMQIQHVEARLKNSALPNPALETAASLKGDTTDIGYVLGAMYDFTPQTRVGVAYRSEVNHKLKGKVKFSPERPGMNLVYQDINARLDTPASLNMGIYHDINDKWAVMAEVDRTYWSSFKELQIYGNKGLDSNTVEKWKDTTFYSIGANYKVDDQWKLRTGFAYDKAAVNMHYRTPRVPDTDRYWYSVGAEYKYDDRITFNAGYTYIYGQKAKGVLAGPDQGAKGSFSADYETSIHLVGLGMNYNF